MELRFNRRYLFILGCSLAAIGYIFSISTASLGVIMLILTWALSYKEISFGKIFKPNDINLLSLFFFFLLIGTLYSLDFSRGIKLVVRQLSFIILPIIFLTMPPLKVKEKKHLVKIYIFSITLFFVICYAYAGYRQLIFSMGGGPFNWYFFYRYDLLEIFNQHPTYVSMFTLLSLSFMSFYREEIFKKKWLVVGIYLVQIIGILLSGSRIGYGLFLLLFLIYATGKLKALSSEKKLKYIFIYLALVLLILVASWNIPIVKERILYTLGHNYNYKFNNKKFVQNGNPEEQGRLLLWQDAMELIELRPLLGYGTGSNMIILKDKYLENNHTLFLNKEFNIHNTYLEVLLSGGLLRLFLYLTILFTIIYKGIKRNDFVLISFFLIISLTSFTETIFRAQGIIFFAFFYCFLLSSNE